MFVTIWDFSMLSMSFIGFALQHLAHALTLFYLPGLVFAAWFYFCYKVGLWSFS